MTFRYVVSAILAVMAFMLSVCAAVARRSEKEIGKAVAKLCTGLIFPVLGNLIIVASVSRNLSLLGSYIYVPGMDLVMYALVNFTEQYCKGVETKQQFDLLTLMVCKLFQGYYFAKPMPREEFERLLLETNSSAGDENRSSAG